MSRRAFTLVELLVVIAIISILATMLLPTLQGAMETARDMACVNNQKQMATFGHLWAGDHGDRLPNGGPASGQLPASSRQWSTGQAVYIFQLPEFGGSPMFFLAVEGYFESPNFLLCPRQGGGLRYDNETKLGVLNANWYDNQGGWDTAVADFTTWQYCWHGYGRFSGKYGTYLRGRRPYLELQGGVMVPKTNQYDGMEAPKQAVQAGLVEEGDMQSFPYLYQDYLHGSWPYRLSGSWSRHLKPSEVVLSNCHVTPGESMPDLVPTWPNRGLRLPHERQQRQPKGGRIPAACMDGSAGMRFYLGGYANWDGVYAKWDRYYADWNNR